MSLEEWQRYSVIQNEMALFALQCSNSVSAALLRDRMSTWLYHRDHLLNTRETELARMKRRFR